MPTKAEYAERVNWEAAAVELLIAFLIRSRASGSVSWSMRELDAELQGKARATALVKTDRFKGFAGEFAVAIYGSPGVAAGLVLVPVQKKDSQQ